MTGICKEGQVWRALEHLPGADQQNRVPSVQALRYLLQACSKKKSLAEAKVVHAQIIQIGLESDLLLGESLVCTLVRCGSLADAVQVFRRLSPRTVSSWNAIISGYNKAGLADESLSFYHRMEEDGVQPNKYTFITVLKSCNSLKDGKQIHASVLRHRCEADVVVANSLIHMYAKCGSIQDARHVFDTIPERTVVSWNSMITGYAEQGQGADAWHVYSQMQEKGISPDARTFVSVLKAFGSLASREADTIVKGKSLKVESLRKGRELFGDIVERGALDVFVGSSLVYMFATCGSTMDARHVFDAMLQRNVVSWNAMIAGYADHEQGEDALQLYNQMLQEGMEPTDRTFVALLKACASLGAKESRSLVNGHFVKVKSLRVGETIHRQIVQSSYRSDPSVGSHLVFMYASCGSIMDAEQVFKMMATHDILSWNAIILAYSEQKQYDEALQLYYRMQGEGVRPDSRTFVSLLKACSSNAASEPSKLLDGQPIKVDSLRKGKRLHHEAVRCGFVSDVFVANSFISMYASCRSMKDAQHVFDALPVRNVVSWNSIIAGYADEEQGATALQLYESMKQRGARPDARTFVSVLKGCSSLAATETSSLIDGQSVKMEALKQVKAIYDEIVANGYRLNVFIGNTAIDLYAKCGSTVDARHVFDTLSGRDVVSWNAMISGYAEQEQGEEAWKLYSKMQEEDVSPDVRTMVSALKAISSLAARGANMLEENWKSVSAELLPKLKAVHAIVLNRGYESDVFVVSTLVKMYANCGSILDAQQVFDSVSHPNVVTWNALIAGYVQRGHGDKALQLYSQMQEQGIRPDAWTFVSLLKAHSNSSDALVYGPATKSDCLQGAKDLYAEIVTHGYAGDIFVANTAIDMFASLGSIAEAQNIFGSLSKRNVVTWNAMIAGYTQQEQAEEALRMYTQMQASGVKPEEATFLCVLRACSIMAVLNVCQQIHQDVVKYSCSSSISVATALIHAYGKCGSMAGAQSVFDSMPERGVVAWNTLIAGYARQGEYERSLQCFKDMQLASTNPDAVTFVSLISACSHAGLVDQGLSYFKSMSDHGITPEMEHYVCMVDLLGRAGLFDQVQELLTLMPMKPSLSVWLSLLGACRKHNNIKLAREAFRHSVLLDPRHSAVYLVMSTIYSQAGLWEKAREIDEMRQDAGAHKSPGRTWIEHRKKVHTFIAGDRRQLESSTTHLYDTLAELSSQIDHLPAVFA